MSAYFNPMDTVWKCMAVEVDDPAALALLLTRPDRKGRLDNKAVTAATCPALHPLYQPP